MKIPKPTDADKAYFRGLFAPRDEVAIKPMFGNIAAFVVENGQMCAGLFGSNLGLRLPDDRREALLAEPGAAPFGPAGRPMKEYASLPASWRDDPARVAPWVDAAIAHTGSLPAKRKRGEKRG